MKSFKAVVVATILALFSLGIADAAFDTSPKADAKVTSVSTIDPAATAVPNVNISSNAFAMNKRVTPAARDVFVPGRAVSLANAVTGDIYRAKSIFTLKQVSFSGRVTDSPPLIATMKIPEFVRSVPDEPGWIQTSVGHRNLIGRRE